MTLNWIKRPMVHGGYGAPLRLGEFNASSQFEAALHRPMVRRYLRELEDREIRWEYAVTNGSRALNAGCLGREPRTQEMVDVSPLSELRRFAGPAWRRMFGGTSSV